MEVTLTPGYAAAGIALLLAVSGLDNSVWNHWLCKRAADWTCSVSEGCQLLLQCIEVSVEKGSTYKRVYRWKL